MQDTELPEKIEPTSLNFQTELASQLAELVPEAMSDGKLDVTKLREVVNGDAENSPEKFGLFWPGKRAAQALAQIPTTATLIPAPEESEDWDSTKNIFIEGDNLEVLKALQNSYRRKVKMIYIDPPYNTGKEFIYPDKFSEGLQGYLEYTGQKNEAGDNVESKPETGGRKHSNWLSMMYPRLQLAKSLLTDDGAIFMSIDDNEAASLRRIADEVFGEDNFIAQVVWERAYAPVNLKKFFSESHDYVLIYARNLEVLGSMSLKRTDEANQRYSNPDNDSRGVWKSGDFSVGPAVQSNVYQITTPSGRVVMPPTGRSWRVTEKKFIELVADNRVWFGPNGTNVPSLKRFLSEVKDGMTPMTLWKYTDVGHSQEATKKLKLLFDDNMYFEYPKPVELIKRILQLGSPNPENDIVMDFFSGSGTTAHAAMQLNAEDGGSRQHIQVQLPELLDLSSDAYTAGFTTIADISKERIRRAGKKIREDYADKIAKRNIPFDTGFRVYKLAPSNFVQWDENKAKDDIQQSVLDFAANKKPDAAPESLLTEIMLQARMPLSANIEKRDLQSGGWVFVVDGGNLITYVANEQITEAQANEIADLAPAKLIVLDSAFNGNNALKINVANICKEKFIKEFKTI
jgi:adenine-specific DNA-methyltransferase